MAQHAITGTWAFVASEWRRADGRHANPFGVGAMGVLMYDGAGYMSAQIMHADRPPVTTIAPTIDTAFGVAIPGFLAYAGTYEVDDAAGVVTHRVVVSSFPPWAGTEHRRRFSIEGDVLTLRDDLTAADGVAVAASTTWRRMA
jgi:lipocalin-like protein